MPTREKPAESFPNTMSRPDAVIRDDDASPTRNTHPFEPTTQRAYRPLGHFILVALFALLAANSWSESIDIVRRVSDAPMGLFWLQLGAGAFAIASGVGVWRQAKWAPYAIAAWGVESAVMIVALGPLLSLEPAARNGLWVGAAIVLGMAAGSVWYLRGSMRGSGAV